MDIEDLAPPTPDAKVNTARVVVPAPRLRSRKAEKDATASTHIPGTQSVWIKTWGCGHNNSDGEYMAGLLHAYGYNVVEDRESADILVLNSCTVKNPSEESLRNELSRANGKNVPVVVAGCVPQASPSSYEAYSILGVHQIDRVVEVVEETLKGHTVRLLREKKSDGRKQGGAQLALPKIRRNKLIEIIPINTGCLNQCTYCKTKHARGELGSYHPDEIVERVTQVLEEGVIEIWLTSEDTGAYGRDIGSSLPELLWRMVDVMKEGTRLRLGMSNPPYILEHVEELAKILNHPRVYKFLHIPVQAASDRVLDVMKREYTVAEFRSIVDVLRAKVPGITIATDIICGFPTETTDEFDMTLDLVREYQFPVLNISQFYPRPGTPAKRMVQVKSDERKRRSRALTEVFGSYMPYATRLGQQYRVLVTEVAADGVHLVGHNEFYEQVLVPHDPAYMGRHMDVQVTEIGKFHMMGKVVRLYDLPVGTSSNSSSSSSVPIHRARSTKPPQSTQYDTRLWFIALALAVCLVSWRIYVRHWPDYRQTI